jgi:hypothetical protein
MYLKHSWSGPQVSSKNAECILLNMANSSDWDEKMSKHRFVNLPRQFFRLHA